VFFVSRRLLFAFRVERKGPRLCDLALTPGSWTAGSITEERLAAPRVMLITDSLLLSWFPPPAVKRA